jgi:hypothetical protein
MQCCACFRHASNTRWHIVSDRTLDCYPHPLIYVSLLSGFARFLTGVAIRLLFIQPFLSFTFALRARCIFEKTLIMGGRAIRHVLCSDGALSVSLPFLVVLCELIHKLQQYGLQFVGEWTWIRALAATFRNEWTQKTRWRSWWCAR